MRLAALGRLLTSRVAGSPAANHREAVTLCASHARKLLANSPDIVDPTLAVSCPLFSPLLLLLYAILSPSGWDSSWPPHLVRPTSIPLCPHVTVSQCHNCTPPSCAALPLCRRAAPRAHATHRILGIFTKWAEDVNPQVLAAALRCRQGHTPQLCCPCWCSWGAGTRPQCTGGSGSPRGGRCRGRRTGRAPAAHGAGAGRGGRGGGGGASATPAVSAGGWCTRGEPGGADLAEASASQELQRLLMGSPGQALPQGAPSQDAQAHQVCPHPVCSFCTALSF